MSARRSARVVGRIATPAALLLSLAAAIATAAPERVSATGWLHLIANGELRILLVDDRGTAVRLIVDEAVGRAHGGLRMLRGKRVEVRGVGEGPDVIRVESIHILEQGTRQP